MTETIWKNIKSIEFSFKDGKMQSGWRIVIQRKRLEGRKEGLEDVGKELSKQSWHRNGILW